MVAQIDPNALQQVINQLQSMAGGAAKMARDAVSAAQQANNTVAQVGAAHQQMQRKMQEWDQQIGGLKIRSSVGAGMGRPDLLMIEDVPGRRIPFDVMIPFGIPANLTTSVPGTYPISMDGPFVATSRFAIFVSSYTFQVTIQNSNVKLVGRSFGRQRPISSVNDIMDAMTGFAEGVFTADNWACPSTLPPTGTITIPSNKSPFRTMEGDFYIQVRDQAFPRQNQAVPSGVWAPGFTQSMQLSVLDYWEKGTVMQLDVEPAHVNNPPNGNVQSLFGSYPFLESQYDSQEGIMYPSGTYSCTPASSDPITRNPIGTLVCGFHGFRILHPAGVAVR